MVLLLVVIFLVAPITIGVVGYFILRKKFPNQSKSKIGLIASCITLILISNLGYKIYTGFNAPQEGEQEKRYIESEREK